MTSFKRRDVGEAGGFLYNRLMAEPAKKKDKSFAALLADRYPGLREKIHALIVEAERAFAGNAPESEGSFLWEHTLYVAGLAFKLAQAEKHDPVLVGVTALLHDAGKFAEGRYHGDDLAEEERAAVLAEKMLPRSRMKADDRRTVAAALRALYGERSGRNPISDLVHDADFLSKFGYLGVAAFFTKSALRGRTLRDSVIRSLSKELTYAACLSLNMRTKSARKMAVRKSADSLSFFRSLLGELKRVHDLSFQIIARRVRTPGPSGRTLSVRLVLPRACEACGGEWRIETGTSRGLKCEVLEARAKCRGCEETHEIAFCLPEIRA